MDDCAVRRGGRSATEGRRNSPGTIHVAARIRNPTSRSCYGWWCRSQSHCSIPYVPAAGTLFHREKRVNGWAGTLGLSPPTTQRASRQKRKGFHLLRQRRCCGGFRRQGSTRHREQRRPPGESFVTKNDTGRVWRSVRRSCTSFTCTASGSRRGGKSVADAQAGRGSQRAPRLPSTGSSATRGRQRHQAAS